MWKGMLHKKACYRRKNSTTPATIRAARHRYRNGWEVRELALLALHAAACSLMYAFACSLVTLSFASLCVVVYFCTRGKREPSTRFAQKGSEVRELDLLALHARD